MKPIERLQAAARAYLHELNRIGPLHRRPGGCSPEDQQEWYAAVETERAHLHETVEDLEVLVSILAATPEAAPTSGGGAE